MAKLTRTISGARITIKVTDRAQLIDVFNKSIAAGANDYTGEGAEGFADLVERDGWESVGIDHDKDLVAWFEASDYDRDTVEEYVADITAFIGAKA